MDIVEVRVTVGELIVVLALVTLVVGAVTVGEKSVDVCTSVTVVDDVSVNHEVDWTVAVVSSVTPSQEVEEYVAVTDVVVEVVSTV